MHTHPNGTAGIIEALEPRLAPAGVISLSTVGGILTISGDGLGNSIAITDVPGTQGPGAPGTGTWTISDPVAMGGTSFFLNGVNKGTADFDIPAQTAIKATLGDGDDRLDIIPSDAPSGIMLSGVLNINAGKGDDIVNLGTGAGQQIVIGGATTVNLGDGNDTWAGNANAVFNGAVSILGGTGNDGIRFFNTGDHIFQKGLSVDLGTGTDTFRTISNLFEVLGGVVSIKGAGLAGTAQTIDFDPDTGMIEGAVTVAMAAGDLTMEVGTVGTDIFRFGAGLTITTGAGDDSVVFDGTVTVAGAVSLDLKDGINTTTLTASRTMQAGSLSIKGGAGTDTVTFDDDSTLIVAGALNVSLGAGANTWNVNPGQSLTAGSLTFTGTTGDDAINFTNASLTIFGSATIGLDAGDNATTLAPTVAGFIGGTLSLTG
ncbi:MAG: hypothetical protein U0984_16110, partial [Prosthecobacter sp.]|nr:hypothetical protein [Prosthecobacter sp.]